MSFWSTDRQQIPRSYFPPIPLLNGHGRQDFFLSRIPLRDRSRQAHETGMCTSSRLEQNDSGSSYLRKSLRATKMLCGVGIREISLGGFALTESLFTIFGFLNGGV